jgi:dipeptidyl-peptidase 4
MRKLSLVLILVIVSLTGFSQKQQYANLREAIFSARSLMGERGPSNITWINGGSQYSFVKNNQGIQEIWIHDIASGDETLAFSAEGLTMKDSENPFRYMSFEWAGDYSYLLFQTNFSPIWRYSGDSDYYYYSIKDKKLELIIEQAFSAEVSPDGTKMGYGKDGDLYLYTFETQKTTRFTDDAEKHFYNGRWGWAYEEEFGLVQAWHWSHDSKYIAFWQSDEREVPIYRLTDFSDTHPQYMEVPYPKVGDKAPEVKVGIINTETSEKTWIDFDLQGGYIPRIYWTSEADKLAIVSLNRAQNNLKLHFADVVTKEKNLVYEETSDTWIDVSDFFSNEQNHFYFPEDMKKFFLVSEVDGWAHIYMIDYNGEKINQVTSGEYEVTGIKAIDTEKKTLYYLSTEVSPLARNLYSIKFNGKKKTRITQAEGSHRVDLSPDGKYFFDSYSDVNTPSQVDFSSTDGKSTVKIANGKNVEEYLETHDYAAKELFSFTNSDGVELEGFLIKPMNFDPSKKYPLLMSIYGGPGSQGVYNTFGTNGWQQWLAQEGFVIANVNNRGNSGYGSPFEKAVYGQLGKYESQDFVETAQHLAKNDWVDGENMAIYGHSYGGFMSSFTMVKHPGVFKVSLVAAPNCDQRLYDCILTERNMGLLEDNEAGYIESAVATHAANLEGKMLLVHSLMDENVHPQHTFQLVNAFNMAGKDVDLRIYPPGDHGVATDLTTYLLLQRQYTDYLMKYLKKGE